PRAQGLWSITTSGRDVLRDVGIVPIAEDLAAQGLLPYGAPERTRDPARQPDVPLLVASYRLLEALLVSLSASGIAVGVRAWEHPWVRHSSRIEGGVRERLSLPAAAVLIRRGTDDEAGAVLPVLLLPDLGTAPLVTHRELIRRLVRLRESTRWSGVTHESE